MSSETINFKRNTIEYDNFEDIPSEKHAYECKQLITALSFDPIFSSLIMEHYYNNLTKNLDLTSFQYNDECKYIDFLTTEVDLSKIQAILNEIFINLCKCIISGKNLNNLFTINHARTVLFLRMVTTRPNLMQFIQYNNIILNRTTETTYIRITLV